MKFFVNFKSAKLNREAQLIVLEQLHLLLKNGFSLNSGLNLLPEFLPEYAIALRKIKNEFSKRQNFCDSLVLGGFSYHLATQLQMSLEQGTLLACLAQLTKLLKVKNQQMKKIGQELAYPFVIMTMMGGLLIFMRIFLAEFIADFKTPSQNFRFWLILILLLVLIAAVFIWFYRALKTENFHQLEQVTKMPFIGSTIKLYINYLVAFNIAILVGNGFSIQRICSFCLTQNQSSLQFQLGEKIANQMKKGLPLEDIIQAEIFLPNQLQLVLNVGHEQKELKKQLNFIQENIFLNLIQKLNRLCLRIQPICFVAIGLGVISMYLKLLLPMYNLMNTL